MLLWPLLSVFVVPVLLAYTSSELLGRVGEAGCDVTTEGRLVTTEGMPVITPREFVILV